MNEKKKAFVINCATCDATQVREETLQQYGQIVINAATVLTTAESEQLLHRYSVAMNAAEVARVPAGTRLEQHNGSLVIKAGDMAQEKSYLSVNGKLTIEPGTEEVLKNYVGIMVNGAVYHPQSLAGKLGNLKVNGSVTVYPDDAVVMASSFTVDKVFILRAKEGQKYFCSREVIITDETLDPGVLTAKNVSFITRRAVLAENLLEAALPLFSDDTEILVVPAGFGFESGDQKLTRGLVRKNGPRLFVLGDLSVDKDGDDLLEKLEKLIVTGKVTLPRKLEEEFEDLDARVGSLELVGSVVIEDKVSVFVGPELLKQDEVTVEDCMEVRLDPNLTPEEIREKLEIQDCVVVYCTPAQRNAVTQISEDVVTIDTGEETSNTGVAAMLRDVMNGNGSGVNAATYTL